MHKFFRKVRWRSTIIAAVTGAVLFSIPVAIYILAESFRASWLLYMGGFLFFAVMAAHTYLDSQARKHSESTVALVFAAHVATLIGIALSCALCLLLLTVLVPGYLGGDAVRAQEGVPTNSILDQTNGMSFQIFFAATMINFSVGSFSAIIIPFAAKRNQKRDARDPAPLHQSGQT